MYRQKSPENKREPAQITLIALFPIVNSMRFFNGMGSSLKALIP